MGTHYKGTDKEVRALDLVIKLMRASESVLSATKGVYSNAGLTESQFEVLEALYHLGPMPQKEIAVKILKSKGNLTTIIRNLLKRKLVSRTEQQADKRYYSIRISPAGEKLIRQIFPAHVRRMVEVMAGLSAQEQVHLADLCKKLGLSISK